MRVLTLLFALTLAAHGQWTIQNSGTTASLRGIAAVTPQVAWASGTEGTVLKTEDGGAHWQRCAVPPGAENLDFRGVQAFDAQTAIVMSSGKGDLSRLYKTVDGCKTWKLVFANPNRDGFWDSLKFVPGSPHFPSTKLGFLLGDPESSTKPQRTPQFALYVTEDGGLHFKRWGDSALEADPEKAGAYAASNTSLVVVPSEDMHGWLWMATGGKRGPRVLYGGYLSDLVNLDGRSPITDVRLEMTAVPLASGESAGPFSIAVRDKVETGHDWFFTAKLVLVGGDYKMPNATGGTAAFSSDGGRKWTASFKPPHGYRSAVAYDTDAKTWITVGPNGTDISTDDGKNWRALKPGPGDAADADQHWNALSLPFVVGPKGRIGVLNSDALKAVAK